MRPALFIIALSLPVAAQETEEPYDLEPAVGDELWSAWYRLWLGNVSGEARLDEPGVSGTDVRLTLDLDLDRNEIFHDVGASAHLGDYGNLRLGWWFGTSKGEETLKNTIRFGGTTFGAGTRVKSEFEAHVASLTYEYPIIPALSKEDQFQLFVQGGLRYVYSSARIASDLATEEGKLSGILPVLGARAELWFWGIVRTELEVSGLYFATGDASIAFVDATLEAGIAPWMGAMAGIGYHLVSWTSEDSSEADKTSKTDVVLNGVYFTFGWRF